MEAIWQNLIRKAMAQKGLFCQTVFARSNTGIMSSNPTRVMDVCVHLFCVDSGLAMADPSSKEFYRLCMD
jgi:hypothetical protein